MNARRNSSVGPILPVACLSTAGWLLAWILSAAAFAAEGEAGWVDVPGRWAPGAARLRVEAAGVPLPFSLPAVPVSEGRVDLEVARGIRLAFQDPPSGKEGPRQLRAMVLRPPEAGTVSFALEVRIPGLEKTVPARLEPRGSDDVTFLSARGGGEEAAWGLYDPRTDRGLDLGGCDEGIRLASRVLPGTDSSAGFRFISIEGRIPRGREAVLFSWRWKDRIFSARGRGGADAVAVSGAAPDGGRAAVGGPAADAGAVADAPSAVDAVAGLSGLALPGDLDLQGWVEKLLAARPAPRLEHVEIEDGWQRSRRARLFKGPSRAWLETLAPQGEEPEETGAAPGDGKRGRRRRDAFPAVRRLVEADVPVGLWIVPHGQSDESVFKERPSAFARSSKGDPIPDAFLGRFIVDGTKEEGSAYLSDLFRALRAQGSGSFASGG